MTVGRITRRQLLAGGAGLAVAGAAAAAVERHPLARLLGVADRQPLAAGAGVLVLVTLYGGNDGLNTVVPLDDAHYLSGRGDLAVPAHDALSLGHGLGLHPNLKHMKQLWEGKRLAIVRGAGYPNPNRSHFRSQDIWQSAVPDRQVVSGWLGRWQDRHGRDPLAAVSIGTSVPLALVGEQTAATAVPAGPFTVPGGDALVRGFRALSDDRSQPSALAGLVARTGAELLSASAEVTKVEGGTTATAVGAAAQGLAGQLDLVATLVAGGLPARVYSVSLSGFDTHAAEKDTHARLLGELDAALGGFFTKIDKTAHGRGVVVAVYSEFGRRVAANASGGTDHGTAAPVFVAGTPVHGGFYGEEPSLVDLDDGDLKFTVDFRSVYATLLAKVLQADPEPILGGHHAQLGFL